MSSLKQEVKNFITARSANLKRAIREVKERERVNKVKEPETLNNLQVRLDELNNMAANFGIKLK